MDEMKSATHVLAEEYKCSCCGHLIVTMAKSQTPSLCPICGSGHVHLIGGRMVLRESLPLAYDRLRKGEISMNQYRMLRGLRPICSGYRPSQVLFDELFPALESLPDNVEGLTVRLSDGRTVCMDIE